MNRINNLYPKTPSELGYYMPAEWEKHDAIWLSWPHDPVTFPDRIDKVEKVYLQLIKAIHKCEQVNLFVKDNLMEEKVLGLLKNANIDLKKINLHLWPYADIWFRDYGPIFIINKNENKIAMAHWIFNAWGCKYKALMKDTEIQINFF